MKERRPERTLMKERQEERLSPLPKIGEGFGEWFEILLKIRRTKEVGKNN